MRIREGLLVSLLLMPLSSCATTPAHDSIAAHGSAMVVDTLYFGTAKPEGRVSPEEWQNFVDGFVTPRFTAGLTWWKASGQWKGERGLEHEETFVLQLVHDDDRKSDDAIAQIVDEYKSRFHQEAVLRLRTTAGAAF
jgi:hypothetical protein